MWLRFNKLMLTSIALLLVTQSFAACAQEVTPPPQPPAPPAGTLEIQPPKVEQETLIQMKPMVVRALKLPEEAAATLPPYLSVLALPVKFSGAGWPANEMVFVDLVIPADVEMKGLDRDRGEDSVGIAVATADSEGRFEAVMESTAKLNWLLRTDWLPTVKPDIASIKPLPNGTYTVRATGIDPRTVATATWELQLVAP
jgi:hypothetical protein